MIVKMYAGPMWAGKTTKLAEGLGPESDFVVIRHPMDSRNCPRDLSVLFPDKVVEAEADWTCPSKDIWLFDEAHFYNVSHEISIVMQFFRAKTQAVREVRIGGIFHDCYEGFTPFPCWRDIWDLSRRYDDIQVEFNLLKSLRPCARCGSSESVFFSVPRAGAKEKIGEDYENLCHKCAFAGLPPAPFGGCI